MKAERIVLASWRSSDLYLDIDWPKVHEQVGRDQLDWLLGQQTTQCQLILDKFQTDFKLVAEFYDAELFSRYHLMWS
jgi:hypothetical protein